jgi:hypothetical protein
MKQLLFLLLFPCLALAQYPANGNQKISLGEQTTADGLVYRGLAADTTRKPSVDTMAFILLDTNTNIIWQYKKATNNAWTRLNILPSDTTSFNYVNTYGTQTVNGEKTFTSAVTATRFNPNSSSATGTGMYLPAANTLGFSTNGVEKVRIKSDGNVGYGTTNPVSLLHIEKAGGITFGNGDQFRVSSGVSGNRAEFHFTDNVTSDAFLSFLPSATASSRYLEISANGAAGGIAVDGNGRLGIGTVSPLAKLNVMGTVRINSASAPDANYYLQLENSSSQKAKANAWDTYSDKRIKTDIQPIVNAIDKVNLLNPVYYQKHDSYVENDLLNIDFDSSVKSLGFIAQEVYNVIPEAVNTGTTNELWAMDYTKIIPILTKAIQEQNALIKALEQRLLILENK